MAIILPSSAATGRTTFLDIVTRVCQEAGIAGSGPSTLSSVSGEYKRVKDWVASSYKDIQHAESNWKWMTQPATFNTEINNDTYSPTVIGISDRFSSYDINSFSCQIASVGSVDELSLTYLDYETWRNAYRVGYTPISRPLYFSVSPQNSVVLGPTPDVIYTISFEYHKTPQLLELDDDITEMPEQFWESIMYRALMKYARFESAPEIYTDAENNYKRILARMRQNQLPSVEIPGPLA